MEINCNSRPDMLIIQKLNSEEKWNGCDQQARLKWESD
jgi:hypothetical protein